MMTKKNFSKKTVFIKNYPIKFDTTNSIELKALTKSKLS